MAKIITHRFASGKTDGPDATQVQPSHWNDGHLLIGGNAGDQLTRDPTDATFGAKWLAPFGPALGGVAGDHLIRDPTNATYGAKWQTPAPVGSWVDVAYASVNFSGSAPMVWTVPSGAQITYAYAVVGRIVFVQLNLGGTSVSVAAGTPLNVTLPSGLLPIRNTDGIFFAIDNGAGVTGRYRIVANDPTLRLYRVDGANWAVSPSNTNISGQFLYQV